MEVIESFRRFGEAPRESAEKDEDHSAKRLEPPRDQARCDRRRRKVAVAGA